MECPILVLLTEKEPDGMEQVRKKTMAFSSEYCEILNKMIRYGNKEDGLIKGD